MATIKTAAGRAKLAPRREPYWEQIVVGRHLGFRAGPGTWVAKVQQDGSRQIARLGDLVTHPDYKDALEAARDFFSHVDGGGSSKRLTVKQAMESYVAGIRGGDAGKNAGVLTDEQREAKAKDVERFVRHSLGDLATKQLSSLTHGAVQKWRQQIKEGRSASSVNRTMTILRAGLNFALEQQAVTSDAAWSKALKSIANANNRRDRYVTLDERRQLLQHMCEDFRPYATLLCLLPLRPGDPEKLQVKHYDPRTHSLNVPAGKTESRKISGLGLQAEDVLRAACKDKLPGAFLFTQRNGKQWIKEARQDVVQEARKAAGLDDEVVLYAIRSSVITDMIVGGADPLTVARISGTSLQMIQKHYGHLVDAHARQALSLVSL